MKKFLFLFLLISTTGFSQNFTQTIRGVVVDRFTQTPLPNAALVVQNSNPKLGGATNLNGKFRIEEVPVGRVTLTVSLLGYETLIVPSIDVTSTEEIVLRIELDQSIEKLEEIVLTEQSENRTENEMVTLSGRTFSIEETQRFAGARNDVSRMAAKLPGVRGTNDAVNDIVIRGNAPSGLLWRLEGLDIPNPNHFGKTGATGGPVSMLNNNVLKNSDFLTAAFPARYSNALSGVFDLRLRTGNNEKHEFVGQVGFNGFELAAEGPINKSKGSSYLVSYRYSVLGLMKAMGLDFGTGSAVPQYQDLAFKLNFPMKNAQSISVFAMGGNSKIDLLVDPEDDNFYSGENINTYSRTTTGVVGVNYYKAFGKKTLLNIQASAGSLKDRDYQDSVNVNGSTGNLYGMDFKNSTMAVNAHLSTKLNAKNHFKVGVYNTFINLNMFDTVFNYDYNRYTTVTNIKGNTYIMRPYAEWQYRPALRWKINAGISSQFIGLTNEFSLEPRLGASYQTGAKSNLNFAYGLHSQLPAVYLFFRQVTLQNGTTVTPNSNLGLTKSHHFVLGYDYMLTRSLKLRAETYYQQINKAVVQQNSSSFSLLNIGSFDFYVPDSLQNSGTGSNVGIDLSLEQFMQKGLYYLATISLYQSKYMGSDGVERNTAWAGDFIINLVGGKEFVIKPKSAAAKYRNSFTIDGSVTYAGGQRYTPVDVAQSQIEGKTVYDHDQAYSLNYPNYFRADLRIGFKLQGKKMSHEWAMDFQNVFNTKNVQAVQYNTNTQEVVNIYQIGILPIFQYRIIF